MYVDKPMRGHGLMQAIARVNRVFKDKPGGLVVDYLGLADELKQALATYTESGGTGKTAIDQAEAVAVHAGEVRDLPRPVPRLRLVALGDRLRHRSGWRSCRGAGARPGAGGRQGATRCRPSRNCPRPSPSPCRTRRPSRSATTSGSSRRCGPPWRKSAPEDAEHRRGPRPRHPAARLAGGRVRGGHRHLRGGRAEEARHLDPLGRVPGRGARTAAAEPGGRAAAEAAERTRSRPARGSNVVQARSFAEMLEKSIRAVPEPGHRDGAGHRGADRARQGDARGRAARAKTRPDRRRARLLRRPGNQRQRRAGAGRRDPEA